MGESKQIWEGIGKADTREPRKADTAYNKRMQEVFDVLGPEAMAERVEASAVQAAIAVETAEMLQQKPNAWQKYKEHHDLKRFVGELDTEWRGRELPNRLNRILMFSVLGSASWAIDYVGDEAGRKLLEKDRTMTVRNRTILELNDQNGNKEAVKAGWEALTDTLIGAFSDISVQQATNRKDAEFISPLSDAAAKIGNIVMAASPLDRNKHWVKALNSFINPSTLEASLRTIATVPVFGAPIERAYIWLNHKLDQDYHLLPVGFDMAASMMAAKVKHNKGVKT